MKTKTKLLLLVIMIFSTLVLYSRFMSTTGLKVREYNVIDKSLSDHFNGLKIVHFSDLLYGTTTNEMTLKKLVKEINLIRPDVVIFTGDLMDSNVKLTKKNLKTIGNYLKEIEVTLYKYAISGDNDSQEFQEIMEQADFIVLDKTKELLYYKENIPLIISNTDDNQEDYYTIRLIHEPDKIEEIDLANVNLVLAGHSLTGQIRLPFYGGLIKKTGSKKYTDSYYKINQVKMYISSGLGTKKYPFRLFNRPSFNFYRFTNY